MPNTHCDRQNGRIRPFQLLALAFLIVMPLTTLASSMAERRKEADSILDTYFERIGGRAVFAAAKGEYIAVEIRDPENAALPYYFEFCASYEEPRSSMRMNSQKGTTLSAYDRGRGWTVSKLRGQPAAKKEWTEARLKIAADDWRGNFETLTHRLAARDANVYALVGEGPWEGWLEIYEKDEPVFHLLINDKGEPVQFRRILDDRAVRFGPLVDFGGYSFPGSGQFEGSYNTFDFHVFFLINETLTRGFSLPGDLDNPGLDCR